MSEPPRVLVLEVDPGRDPISGRLREGAESEAEEFVGWLGLARALERVLGPALRAGSDGG